MVNKIFFIFVSFLVGYQIGNTFTQKTMTAKVPASTPIAAASRS